MIRRDYIMRLVAEMVQVLARVVSLRQRQEYELALREIDAALGRIRDSQSASARECALEDWIALCRKHGQAASGLEVAVADLLKEQGEVFALQDKGLQSHQARALSLGLFLEALLGEETFVSAELLGKVDQLLEETRDASLPAPVLGRLFKYFEARGRYAKAEDTLFAWLEVEERPALEEGLAFYQRLLARDDAELEWGDLPRAEVEEGSRAFLETWRKRFPDG